jgi:transposase
MKTHRDILRHILGLQLSANETHAILGISRGKIQDCLKRAQAAHLRLEQIDAMLDDELESLLFPEKELENEKKESYEPDWEKVLAELQRRGVKLRLLYDERYESAGFDQSYSQFCRRFKKWRQSREIDMRQEHIAGEKLYIDFAGMTVAVTNPETGEVTQAQIFVATFGASNYTYFEAVASQKLADWISAHINAFKYFGGLPKFLIPDNLKSAVTAANRFDPILNRTYERFAKHYNLGIIPARKYRPKDKSKVEKGVQNTEYRVLAKLRDRTFFSIDELNRELAILREESNGAPFQKLSGSRASWFANVDKPALRPLPSEDFEFEEWLVGVRVARDYHINLSNHYYSVPFHLVDQIVDVRFTSSSVEVIHNNSRVASHVRNWAEGAKSTLPEHLAPAHAAYHGLTPEYFVEQSARVGPNTKVVVQTLLKHKPYPQLSFGECFGIIKNLKNDFGDEELELACAQAIRLQSIGYRVIKNILKAGVKNLPQQITMRLGNINHDNLRGSKYYH